MADATNSDAAGKHVVFHYPPEVLQLLKDVIPLLCRSKMDMLTFFSGAGVPERHMADLRARIANDRTRIGKFEISRTVLERLNLEKGDHLRELREIVRRVTEFEDFSTCWPADQLKAKGLVAELSRVVNVKDSFTRMRIERDEASSTSKANAETKAKALAARKKEIQQIQSRMNGLFSETDVHKRGKNLEPVLNDLFTVYGMTVREAFTVKGSIGQGVIEQIDGVVEIDGDLYLVEMKWWNSPIGTAEVSQHLVRIFNRGQQVRGIFISYTDYTVPAIQTCRDAISNGAVVALCTLKEIVWVIENEERGADLKVMLRNKVQGALLDKNPWQPYQQS